MKLPARLALAFCAALCLIACSAADIAEPVATEQQAASTNHTVWNGWTTIGTTSSKFCRAYYMGASGGHSGSPTWGNGVPKIGAGFDMFPTSIGATPYSTSFGSAVGSVTCQDKSDFGITGGQSSDDAPFYILFGPAYGSSTVSGSSYLWSEQAFCYLNGVYGLSTSNECVRVTPPAGSGDWQLYVSGVADISGSAKCVHPNRSWTLSGPFTATYGNTAVGAWAANSFCGITEVTGNLDDSYVWVRSQWGYWTLEVGSGVTAKMHCATF